MALSQFELHPDRLATTDARGRRIFLYPADVKGFFRRQRSRLQFILILFFLGLPWIKINGRQALLLDIAHRKFEIFGASLRAHNAPLLIFVFSTAAFALFFATAVFGRVWCGWACPQTVFIDGIFRRIERWIEGSALERRKLADSPFSTRKLMLYSLKWILYIAVTLVITHSFLAYFVGTSELHSMMVRPPRDNWGSFHFMVISTAVILFDFAWFREQFCTIVCPYGRFQSVLMDKSSMIVSYDIKRGEPRATPELKSQAKLSGNALGDCVNCYRCVQVCPTGIDIRRGLQMECIACTGCIDACDDVMTKLKKPTGLIRYDTLLGNNLKRRISMRAWIYLALCILSTSVLILSIGTIRPVDIKVLRAKDSPYVTQNLNDGSVAVLNHFKLELSNQSGAKHELTFKTKRKDDGEFKIITAVQPFVLNDAQVTQADIFIQFSKSRLINGMTEIHLIIEDKNENTEKVLEIEKEVTLVGPFS